METGAVRRPHVVVVGSLNCDVIVHVDRLPTSGETILGHEGALAAGGKGLNQAVAAAQAGAEVHLVGMVGDDAFGRRLRDHALRSGVDCSLLGVTADRLSGVATITVAADGANMIAVAPGANSLVDAAAIERADDVFAAADVMLVQLETPFDTVERALRRAREKGALSILNPAPADPAALALCRLADVMTPNEHEMELLTGIKLGADPEGLRAALEALGAPCVVATLGGEGCAAFWHGEHLRLPAFRVDVVDTTGAGDTFSGALAAALAEGMAIGEALRFSSAAAAIAVSRPSAEGAAPTRAEIVAFLADHGA